MKILPYDLDNVFSTKLSDLTLGKIILAFIAVIALYYIACFVLSFLFKGD